MATRREVLLGMAAAGMGAFAAPELQASSAKSEQEHAMAAGLTAEEADCWVAAADVAAKFFALPEVHPMDKQEVASAIHILQNKLLSRPTYRSYLKSHGAPQRK